MSNNKTKDSRNRLNSQKATTYKNGLNFISRINAVWSLPPLLFFYLLWVAPEAHLLTIRDTIETTGPLQLCAPSSICSVNYSIPTYFRPIHWPYIEPECCVRRVLQSKCILHEYSFGAPWEHESNRLLHKRSDAQSRAAASIAWRTFEKGYLSDDGNEEHSSRCLRR